MENVMEPYGEDDEELAWVSAQVAQLARRAAASKADDDREEGVRTTVRVRVLVAVDHNGKWISHGHSASTDQSFREWTWSEDIEPNDGEALYWIEADVPVPAGTRETIRGVVRAAK